MLKVITLSSGLVFIDWVTLNCIKKGMKNLIKSLQSDFGLHLVNHQIRKNCKVKKWPWIFLLLPLCISAAGHSSKYHPVSSLGGTGGRIEGGTPLHSEWILPWQAECGVAAGWQNCDHLSSPAEAAECRRWGENFQPEQPAGAGPGPMDSRVRGHMQGHPQCSTRTTSRNNSLQDH